MAANIEIKARVQNPAALKERAERLSDVPVQVIPQVDTFFKTEKGRLKLRELGNGAGQLIYYERVDDGGPKRSDYFLFETSEPEQLKSVLTRALGARGQVRKLRYLYLVGQTRVHLDVVEGLGSFMELEVVLRPDQSDLQGQDIANNLMSRLGVARSDLLEGAYMDMLEQDG